MDQMSENILDACSARQLDARIPQSRQHRQIVWCTGRLGGRVPERSALHEEDRLLAIAAYRCGGHCHLHGRELPYHFTKVDALVEDFIAAVDAARRTP